MPNHEKVMVELPGGDALFVETDHHDLGNKAPVVMLFHGLGGCSRSPYMLSISWLLARHGIKTARFNHRGCGPGGRKLAKEIYHSGRRLDMILALETVARKFSSSPVFAVGFSLSANMLLNIAGERSNGVWPYNSSLLNKTPSKNIESFLSVCPPLDLDKCSLKLTRLLAKPFDLYFALKLRKEIQTLVSEHRVETPSLNGIFGVRTFDEKVTAQLSGYPTAADYYRDNSSIYRLADVKTDVTVLASEDDSVVDTSDYRVLSDYPNISTYLTKNGGHMGYLHRQVLPSSDKRWMDYFVLKWLKDRLSTV